MRITAVTLIGFGGVPDQLEIDLDADVVLLIGANGFGKTTICDAVAWALTGDHPRAADPRCLYSRSGETSVALRLRDTEGSDWLITRTVSNPDADRGAKILNSAVCDTPRGRLRGDEATSAILRKLVPKASPDADPNAAQRTLQNSYYMQQESLREFLSTRTDDERFTALSRMVGAGGLTDLVTEFDKSKTAWSRATNSFDHGLEANRRKVEQLRDARSEIVAELNAANVPANAERWTAWQRRVLSFLGREDSSEPLPPEPTSAVVERTLMTLSEFGRQVSARDDQLAAVLAESLVPLPASVSEDQIAAAQLRVTTANQGVETLDSQCGVARAQVEQVRQELQRLTTERAELASMAQLALRHISDDCPTCGQHVDADELRERLSNLIRNDATPAPRGNLEEAEAQLNSLEAGLVAAKDEARIAGEDLNALLEAAARAGAVRDRRRERIAQAGLTLPDDATGVELSSDLVSRLVGEERTQLADSLAQLADLEAEADAFKSIVLVTRARARIATTDEELETAQQQLSADEADLTQRRATGERAEALLRTLRTDADSFVSRRLDTIEPLLSHLYAAIDPHPTFRSIRLATRMRNGKHRLDPVVTDDVAGVQATEPGKTLSTSQANAMAVALFLAFNLGLTPTSLQTLVIDDPLQNLDDVHLLGLVDMLRRVSPYRQLVLSTHDANFAALLARKLRPVESQRRVLVIRITKWDETGPLVTEEDVPVDESPLKIATAS